MIDVVNLQRKVKIDASAYREFVAKLSLSIDEAKCKTFSVAFISDRRMKELNAFFRSKHSTTDVLSFPHESDDFPRNGSVATSGDEHADNAAASSGSDYLGDIVISVEQAQRQAKENRLTLENEMKQLILHGLLHLCGYDHETDHGEMNRRELILRRKLKI